MKKAYLFYLLLAVTQAPYAQLLKPGFDKEEYKDLMSVSAQFGDSSYRVLVPPPANYKWVYSSAVTGLDNKWELWMSDAGVPVISIRGTIASDISWMANFYAAMVPAKGELQLSGSSRFTYQLASNPQAAVHTGWLVSTAFLVQDILPKIDSLYKKGHSHLLVIGHSQGGAIAYLLHAYLHNLQRQGTLSPNIRIKTYCSAAPKPGNLFFAHEYEAATQGGWAYNVINTADWVPETPITVQTLSDFTAVNPFVNAKEIIRQQSFFKRLALNYAFGKLKNPTEKASKNYRKYLGNYVAKSIKKHLPGFQEPAYSPAVNYVRTGNIITLLADESYFKTFPQNDSNIFVNHFHLPYLYLLNKLNMDGKPQPLKTTSLNGTWEADYVSGIKTAFEQVYANQKPLLTIDAATGKITGHTSCNSFNGTAVIEANRIQFPEEMAVTKMSCPGDGEAAFLNVLRRVNRYAVTENALTFIVGDIAVMRLVRK